MGRCTIFALGLLTLVQLGISASEVQAQALDGTWEITAVIDDGRVVEPTDVLLNYAADGRVVVRGQTVELVVPMTFQRKQLPGLWSLFLWRSKSSNASSRFRYFESMVA
jgi:hypothetical protein